MSVFILFSYSFYAFQYKNKFLKENSNLPTLTILKSFWKQDICLFKLCIGASLLYNATEKLNHIIYIHVWARI